MHKCSARLSSDFVASDYQPSLVQVKKVDSYENTEITVALGSQDLQEFLWCLSFNSLMNEVVHTSPTIGSNVEEIVVKNTHFLMWVIGGQESLRSSWNTYYSNTEVY